MGELIRREGAKKPLSFSGERLTSATTGQVEIEHYHRYLLAREFCRGRDVLDVAAGEGYGTALLAQVARSALGVEIDPASVEAARTEFRHAGLRFEQGDARALPLPDASIDVAVSFETLEHLAEHDLFLSELRRVLRPDGLLILSTPDRDVYSPLSQPPNPYHVLELTRPEFAALVARHFPHHRMTAQRAMIGSLIVAAGHEGDTTLPVQTYERRGEALIEGSRDLARAPYLVAFASAAPLPPIPGSVYVYRSDIDTDPRERQEALDARNDAEQAAIHAEGRTAAMDARRLDAEARIDAALFQAAHYTKRTAEELELRQHTATRLDQAERALAAAEARAQGAEAEANALRHHLEVAAQAAEAARAGLHAVQTRLSTIEGSNVWRASGPLRHAAARHPGLARLVTRAAKLAWWTGTFQLGRRYSLWRAATRPALVSPTLALPYPASPLLALTMGPAALEAPAPAAPTPTAPASLPTADRPLVSILICTYGQVAVTLACLRSIADHPPACPFEVILVDDAYPGPEDTTPFAAIAGLHLVRNAANLGFLLSCNKAARAASGRYLHLLNNDTELRPGAIDALVALLESHPRAAIAGSKLVYPDGTLQEAGGILWNDASGWNYGRGEDPARADVNYVREVDYCSGASILIRRAVWDELGGFDEAFAPAYYEDTDLAFRVRAAGHTVLYEPRSVVVHLEGASHGTDITSGIKAHQAVNQARMIERWGPLLQREHYPNGTHVLRARDRARHRRTILVIDHYTPEPDRDAGSRTMLGVLESLAEAGWVVKFWPYNRQYSPIYTPPLEAQGIEVLDQRWPGDLHTWLATHGADLDHLMVSRPDIAADIMHRLMRDTPAVFSFYGHDLHFARMRRQAAVLDDPALLADAARMEQIERRVWRNFDVAIYLSEDEAAAVRAMAPGTHAVAVVPYRFDIAPRRTEAPSDRTILFVAGFAHPPNVDAALFLMQEIVPRLEQRMGTVRVVLAGSKPSDAVRALAGPDVEVTGWLSDQDLAARYATHRVAVVPLRFGAGVKGKVVEALSHGLPLVTTGVGAQGIAGLDRLVPVHDDVEGLVEGLHRLLTDDDAWLAQSHAQTDFAERRFSRAAMRASVVAALEAGEAAAPRLDGAPVPCLGSPGLPAA